MITGERGLSLQTTTTTTTLFTINSITKEVKEEEEEEKRRVEMRGTASNVLQMGRWLEFCDLFSRKKS